MKIARGRCLAAALLALARLAARRPSAGAGRADRHARQGARRAARSRSAYRESSVPFSYLSARGEPIGYSIELCKQARGCDRRGGRARARASSGCR